MSKELRSYGNYSLIAVLLAVLAVMPFWFGACGGKKSSTPYSPSDTTGSGAHNTNTNKSYTVVMQSLTFNPKALTIATGDTVIWVNNDSAHHTVTSGLNGVADGQFSSADLGAGDRYTHVFSTIGTYPYYCIYHYNNGMTGSVNVQASAAEGY